jgi:hypothetical protein
MLLDVEATKLAVQKFTFNHEIRTLHTLCQILFFFPIISYLSSLTVIQNTD